MRRIFAQAKKELLQTYRDRLSLALALVLPLVLLTLFGTAISFSVTNLPVAVQDLDRTPMSRKYIDQANASLTFHVIPLPLQMNPEDALKSGLARAAVVIPENFEHDLVRGFNVDVQWLIDATDANTANIMRGNASAVSQSFVATIHPTTAQPAIAADTRLWYNPGRRIQKIYRTRRLCSCAGLISAIAGRVGYVTGNRSKNDFTGLRIQHFRS